MKKMFFLSTMAILGTSSVFWGCKNDVVLAIPENEQGRLKSGEIVAEKVCSPSNYSLVTKNNREVGQMTVSNDDCYLTVEFEGYGSSVSEVQLWVGTELSMVPKNGQDTPVPGRFTYRETDKTVFRISLSDLFTPGTGVACDGKEVFIFAHVEMMGSGFDDDEETSAWSEGTPFGTSRWGSYSSYTIRCNPPVGEGCTPYIARCNYNNNTGGRQKIYIDNEDFVGEVEYDGEKMVFYFKDGSWMFTDLLPNPVVLIYGYNKQDSKLTLAYEGEPIPNQGPFTVPVAYYNYYKIQLNVQNCY